MKKPRQFLSMNCNAGESLCPRQPEQSCKPSLCWGSLSLQSCNTYKDPKTPAKARSASCLAVGHGWERRWVLSPASLAQLLSPAVWKSCLGNSVIDTCPSEPGRQPQIPFDVLVLELQVAKSDF